MRLCWRLGEQKEARKVFKKARADPCLSWQVFDAAAQCELCLSLQADEGAQVAARIYAMGVDKFPTEVPLLLRYLRFLQAARDHTNMRALLEKSLQAVTGEGSRELWREYVELEVAYGDAASVRAVADRRAAVFPEYDPASLFSVAARTRMRACGARRRRRSRRRRSRAPPTPATARRAAAAAAARAQSGWWAPPRSGRWSCPTSPLSLSTPGCRRRRRLRAAAARRPRRRRRRRRRRAGAGAAAPPPQLAAFIAALPPPTPADPGEVQRLLSRRSDLRGRRRRRRREGGRAADAARVFQSRAGGGAFAGVGRSRWAGRARRPERAWHKRFAFTPRRTSSPRSDRGAARLAVGDELSQTPTQQGVRQKAARRSSA